MTKYKFLTLLVSISALNGCTFIDRKIEHKYDEISKKNVCRVQIPYIISRFGRDANLTLERENNGIKATILTHDISTLLMRDKNFYNNPSISFNLFTHDQLIDHIDLKSQTVDIKHWDHHHYKSGNDHHSNTTALFSLTIDQLKKISNAESVTLVISDNKNSLEGDVGTPIIKLLGQFVTECFYQTEAMS